MNILFIENHDIFPLQVARLFLSSHSVTIVPSISGAKSLSALRDFDLVLCDYDLDDGKGDEFVAWCRVERPSLKAIAVSSHDAGNTALQAAGAFAVCNTMDFSSIQRVMDHALL